MVSTVRRKFLLNSTLSRTTKLHSPTPGVNGGVDIESFQGRTVRDIIVEFGNRNLTVSMREARKWVAAGLAEWLPRRNRMAFIARRDPKPVLRGLSAVVGETAVEALDPRLAQTFIRNQFLKREISATK